MTTIGGEVIAGAVSTEGAVVITGAGVSVETSAVLVFASVGALDGALVDGAGVNTAGDGLATTSLPSS